MALHLGSGWLLVVNGRRSMVDSRWQPLASD
jgi:hypothetical protein